MPYQGPKKHVSWADPQGDPGNILPPDYSREENIPEDWKRLLRMGEKIALIKKVREQYHCGLVEAKKFGRQYCQKFPASVFKNLKKVV